MPINIYIIDTSALIDLKPYPSDVFKTLWTNIERLIKRARLISPKQVLDELSKKDDVLFKWAKRNRTMFKDLTQNQIVKVKEIVNKFPTLIDVNKEIQDADPFVISLALITESQQKIILIEEKKIVITQEVYKENKINIPQVCKFYDIEYLNIIELFRRENWTF